MIEFPGRSGRLSRVRWEYCGTVFDQSNRPAYAEPTTGLWAPDIRYLGGRYVMYYTVTDTTANPGEDPAIGVATAPQPDGPWTPQDKPIIAPRLRPGTDSSRDGQSWIWGAVWTFSPGEEPRIGLVAHGGSSPAVTAAFDYVRFYATTWPAG